MADDRGWIGRPLALARARAVVRNLPLTGPEVGPGSLLWNEEALLDRLLAGDEEAFSYLVRRYSAPMARVARRFVLSG
jgi:hypothetical protein